ncbi:uncharacterized protein LOC128724547 [Anopheles nili]|uniref:uncharacterized protein LOC128724547 n=1 Tax=Anopheles nili TaxID=185578 RepID=UPI00237C1047|nr:uncharacterized protein LOC128724547 [Anopheles nili]
MESTSVSTVATDNIINSTDSPENVQEKRTTQSTESLPETDEAKEPVDESKQPERSEDISSGQRESVHQTVDESNEKPANEQDEDEDEEKLQQRLQTLKGDRIGETMYSERFVLSTILKLSKQENKLLKDDEEFEHDLCNLWDMTIEPDVVRFLLQQDVTELFLALAANSKDDRLIEILFGIFGNMCCVEEMHDLLKEKNNILVELCDFLAITDALALVQLMRTFTTLFDRSDDERYHWFGVIKQVDNLTEKIALILATSTSRELLQHTVETVNAMINRFTEAEVNYEQLNEFYRLFAKSCLMEGLFEAFWQLYPMPAKDAMDISSGDDFDEDTLTLKDIRTMRRFLEIHEHFMVNANELYETYVNEVDQCVQRVLSSFVRKNVLLPVTRNHVTIFVAINKIFSGIMYHFRPDTFINVVRIYDLLAEAMDHPTQEDQSPVHDAADDRGVFDLETACEEVREIIFYLVAPINEKIIRAAIQAGQLKESSFERLCRELRETMDGEPLLYQTCAKLMKAIHSTDENDDLPHRSDDLATRE